MELFFSQNGFGQIISEKISYQGGTVPVLLGRISDTTRLSAVPLAHVLLMHKNDTVKLVADLSGRFYYNGQLSDTMRVQVTAIGFKPFSGLYIPKRHGLDIGILLKQDAVVLDEVIIMGKRLLMVVKGDTLQYNTDEVRTLDKAKLGDVLQKLPGVTMENGLKVNGVPIHRIYVNGDTLFKGTDALKHITADNVKDVKVFDERNKEDLAQGLKYGRREKVMDVTTKRKVTRQDVAPNARQQKRHMLSIGGGVDASRNRTSKYPEKFLISYAYKKGNTMTNGLSFSGDYSNLFLQDKQEFGGDFEYSKRFRKIVYRSKYTYHNATTYDNRWEEQDYFPTERYDSRRYEQASSEKNIVYKYATSQSFGFQIKKINVQLGGQYSYGADKNWNNNWVLSTMDNEVINSVDVRNYNREYTSQGNVNFRISTAPKKKNTFTLSSSLNLVQGGRKGWQVDTLETSSRYVFLCRDWDNNDRTWHTKLEFNRVISRLLKISLTGAYSYKENSSNGFGENRLTGLLDTNNTRNYTFYGNSCSVGGVLMYYGDRVEITGGGTINYQSRNQVERFPVREQSKDRFLFFNPKWSLRATFSPTLNLSADYSSQTTLPTAGQLRREINDANPLYLSGGNPLLKPTKEHKWIILFNKIILPSSAFKTEIYFTLTQDPIVSNSRYFTETTHLSEYDYTVERGATLNTYENSDPKYELSIKFGYDRFWSFLGRCKFETAYFRMKEPSFMLGERNDLMREAGEFEVNILTNFSKKAELNITSMTILGRSESRIGQANELLQERVRLQANTTIIPKFRIRAEMDYDYQKNLTLHHEKNNMILNASISRGFKYFSMELKGVNLLDSRKNDILIRTAEYDGHRGFAQTGRYVTLILSSSF